jgi:hypothetical protein
VITAKCAIKTERKEVEKYEKGGKKKGVEFSTQFTTQMTFTNPKTGQMILEPLFESNATEDTRDESINKALAVGHTKGKQTFVIVQLLTLDEYLQEKYPMRATIATVNESKKGKAEYVTINIGGKSAVYRGQTFEVIEDNGGKEKRWGKLRVREINSDTTATCSVEKGGKDILSRILISVANIPGANASGVAVPFTSIMSPRRNVSAPLMCAIGMSCISPEKYIPLPLGSSTAAKTPEDSRHPTTCVTTRYIGAFANGWISTI